MNSWTLVVLKYLVQCKILLVWDLLQQVPRRSKCPFAALVLKRVNRIYSVLTFQIVWSDFRSIDFFFFHPPIHPFSLPRLFLSSGSRGSVQPIPTLIGWMQGLSNKGMIRCVMKAEMYPVFFDSTASDLKSLTNCTRRSSHSWPVDGDVPPRCGQPR